MVKLSWLEERVRPTRIWRPKGQESPCMLFIHSPADRLHILCAKPGPMAHSLSLISRERIFRLRGTAGGGDKT